MKKFLVSLGLLFLLDYVTLFFLKNPLIYGGLWLIILLLFRIPGSYLFIEGLLASTTVCILMSEPPGNLKAFTVCFVPLVLFGIFLRKEEDFMIPFCIFVPFWLAIAFIIFVTDWVGDCLNGGNLIAAFILLGLTICRSIAAILLNLGRNKLSERIWARKRKSQIQK